MTSDNENIPPVFKIVRTIWNNRKPLLIFNGSIAVISIIILLLLPNKYKSTALVMIEDSEGMMAIPAILKDMPLNLGFGGSTSVLRYMRLANSKTVLDSIIAKFDLDQWYETEYREDTYETIMENLELIDNDDGSLSISYISVDNEMAADVVKEIFRLVRNLDITIINQTARSFREFIEERNYDAFQKLALYEDSLRVYSENTGIINIEEQIKQTIKTMATLEAKKIDLEIQRDFLKSNVSSQTTTLAQLEEHIRAISKLISELKQNDSHSNIPLNKIPEQGMIYLRLFRNLKIQETIIQFLVPQLENAKLEEKKNYSSLIMIDFPVPAEKKHSPRRSQILFVILFLSSVMSLAYYRIREYLKLNQNLLNSILSKKIK